MHGLDLHLFTAGQVKGRVEAWALWVRALKALSFGHLCLP